MTDTQEYFIGQRVLIGREDVNTIEHQLAEAKEKLVAAEARIEELTTILVEIEDQFNSILGPMALVSIMAILQDKYNLSALREHDVQLLEKAYERLERISPILTFGLIKIELDDMAAEIRAQGEKG